MRADNSFNYLARVADNLILVLPVLLRRGCDVKKFYRVLLAHVSGKDGVKRHLSGFSSRAHKLVGYAAEILASSSVDSDLDVLLNKQRNLYLKTGFNRCRLGSAA